MEKKGVLLEGMTSISDMIMTLVFFGVGTGYLIARYLILYFLIPKESPLYIIYLILYILLHSSIILLVSVSKFILTIGSFYKKKLIGKTVYYTEITIEKVGYVGYRGSYITIHFFDNMAKEKRKRAIHIDKKQYREVKSNCHKYGIEFYDVHDRY